MTRHRLFVVVALCGALVFAGRVGSAVAGPVATNSEIRVLPEAVRVVDTRVGDELPAVLDVGEAGRPVWAFVAVVNVAVVGADEPGFVTLWDCTGTPPDVAHLNYDAGAAASSMAFAPLGPAGELCVERGGDPDVDVVVDVQAWTRPGGFIPL